MCFAGIEAEIRNLPERAVSARDSPAAPAPKPSSITEPRTIRLNPPQTSKDLVTFPLPALTRS